MNEAGLNSIKEITDRCEVMFSLALSLTVEIICAQEACLKDFTALFGDRAGYSNIPWAPVVASIYNFQGSALDEAVDAAFGQGRYSTIVAGLSERLRKSGNLLPLQV